MSSNRSESMYRLALLVPLEQSSPDYVVDTTAIQLAEPVITQVVAQTDSRLVLEAQGTVDSDTHLEFLAGRGGSPGRTTTSAGLLWRNVATPEEDYRGQDVPNMVAAHEFIARVDGSGVGVIAIANPKTVSLSDGTVVVLAQVRTGALVDGGYYHLAAYVLDPDTGTWSGPEILYSQLAAPTWGMQPAACVDEDDVVHVHHWIEDPDRDEAQVRYHYSTDGGSTWTVGGLYCLPESIDISTSVTTGYMLGKLTTGMVDGDMLLIAELTTRVTAGPPTWVACYAQYASTSRGASFELVEQYDPAPVGARPYGRFEIVVLDGLFYVVHAGGNTSNDEGLFLHVLTSPWEAFSVAREIQINGNAVAGDYSATTGYLSGTADIAACVDFHGVLYVVHAYVDNGGYYDAITITRSEDDGETWSSMGSSPSAGIANAGVIWRCDSTADRPRNLSLCPQRGRLLLVHNYESTVGTLDGSLGVTYLGGWTNRTTPGESRFPSPARRTGWTKTWYAFGPPTDMGWSAGGAGKSGSLGASGSWDISGVVGTLYYEDAPTATQDEGLTLDVAVSVIGSPLTSSVQHGVVLQLADGTDDYRISVRIGADTVVVYDDHAGGGAGASIGSINIETQSAPIELRVELKAGACIVLARVYDTSADRYWTGEVQSSSLVNDTATPAGANLRQWGAIASSLTGSSWWEVKANEGVYYGYGHADGFDSPADLMAGPLTAEPYPVAGNVWVYATQGPARYGDRHRLQADHVHALRYAFPSVLPSSARGLRTVDDASDLIVPIQLHATNEVPLPPAIGLVVRTNGIKTLYLEGYTGGSWQTLATGEAYSGREGSYSLSGDRAWPASGTAWSRHTSPAALGGCVAELVNGGTTKLRRIRANDGGVWDPSITARQELLTLEGCDGTEPATGTIRVWDTTVALIAHLTGDRYTGLRLRVPAQSTVDGYLEVLWLEFCEVLLPCVPPSQAWVWTYSPGAELEEADDRSATPYVLAELQRTLELPWMDMIPTHHVERIKPPDPGYLVGSTAGGAAPVANMGDWPSRLMGHLRRLNGPARPVALVLDPTADGATEQTFVGRDQVLLAQMTSEGRIERVSEWGVRMRGITLRETM